VGDILVASEMIEAETGWRKGSMYELRKDLMLITTKSIFLALGLMVDGTNMLWCKQVIVDSRYDP